MGRTELGQVLDREALSSSEGARGLVRVRVPVSWVEFGSEIELAIPVRVECARCFGGGCDPCGRSGALRRPDDPSARAVRVQIPAGSVDGVALRLVRPFGEGADIEQLIIEVRCGDLPSGGVARVDCRLQRASEAAPSLGLRRAVGLGAALLITLALISGAIMGAFAGR